jgi:parvulin-like peptidyl-prolyl isomerase
MPREGEGPRRSPFRGAALFAGLFAILAQARGGEAAMIELDEVRIPAASVWRIEKAWLERAAAAKAEEVWTVERRLELRRRIAFTEFEAALAVKVAAELKLALRAEEAEAEVKELQRSLKEAGSSYEQFLAAVDKTDAEYQRIRASQLALERQAAKELKAAEVEQEFKNLSDQLGLRRARHLLFSHKSAKGVKAERTREAAEAAARKALADLEAGREEFEGLAGRVSDDAGTRGQGGDLGWVARKSPLEQELVDAVYALPRPGALSAVLETTQGFHVAQLTEARGLKELTPELRRRMAAGRARQVVESYRAAHAARTKVNEELLGQAPPGERP